MPSEIEVKVPYQIHLSLGEEAEKEAAELFRETRIALCGAIRKVGRQWEEAGIQATYTLKVVHDRICGDFGTNGAIHEIKHAILAALKAPR